MHVPTGQWCMIDVSLPSASLLFCVLFIRVKQLQNCLFTHFMKRVNMPLPE